VDKTPLGESQNVGASLERPLRHREQDRQHWKVGGALLSPRTGPPPGQHNTTRRGSLELGLLRGEESPGWGRHPALGSALSRLTSQGESVGLDHWESNCDCNNPM